MSDPYLIREWEVYDEVVAAIWRLAAAHLDSTHDVGENIGHALLFLWRIKEPSQPRPERVHEEDNSKEQGEQDEV